MSARWAPATEALGGAPEAAWGSLDLVHCRAARPPSSRVVAPRNVQTAVQERAGRSSQFGRHVAFVWTMCCLGSDFLYQGKAAPIQRARETIIPCSALCMEQGVWSAPPLCSKPSCGHKGGDKEDSSRKRGIMEPGASRQVWGQKAEPGGSIRLPPVVPPTSTDPAGPQISSNWWSMALETFAQPQEGPELPRPLTSHL